MALAAGALALNRLLVGVFYDDGIYAGLAVSLARGTGYAHPHLPGTPHAVHYPPLYPLLLAPLFAALPLAGAAFAAKVANLVMAGAAAGILAWHAERARLLGERAPRGLAATVVAAGATAIPLLSVQAVLFSEPLFLLLLAVGVALADPPLPPLPRPGRWPPAAQSAAVGLVAALALLTRSIGLALGLGAALFALLVRGDPWRRALLMLGPAAAAGLAWGAWVLLHRDGIDPALALGYGSYAAHLEQAGWSALAANVRELPRPLGALTLGWLPHPAVYIAVGLPALAVLLYGLALLARRSAAGLALCCYLGILAAWPFFPDRFLWAVFPWLALAWTAGTVALLGRRALRVPLAVVAASVAIGYGSYQIRGFAGRWWEGAARGVSRTFSDVLPAVRELPEDAVVATDDEALVWLYTGRLAVPLYIYSYRGRETVEPSVEQHRAYLDRQGVTHILLASPSSPAARELRALIGAYPGWLAPVRSWPGGRWLFAVSASPLSPRERGTGGEDPP